MEIEILQEDSRGFEMKILGEDHTFLNLLNSFLSKNKKVEHAAYKIEHPLVGVPKLFFKLKGVSKIEDILVGDVKGIGPKTAELLLAQGIRTADQLVLQQAEKLAEKTGIAETQLSKYIKEAKKKVPEDRFGYRAVLKETLSEVSKALKKIKKGV